MLAVLTAADTGVDMKLIGITGGVGAGKSQILSYIEKNTNSRILLADEAAHIVKEPGQPCYTKLVQLLGEEVLEDDGQINKGKMAARIFADKEILAQVNAIIHPAVKTYILNEIDKERKAAVKEFFFLEAALLIEEGYHKIVDEMWYIYAAEPVRRQRLKENRGYSDEKITQIMKSQLSEETFRAHCKEVIDNSNDLLDTYRQIDEILQRNRELR